MKVTLDVGSAWWVNDENLSHEEDLKIIVDRCWNHKAEITLGFPRMNDVDVDRVDLRFTGCELLHPEAIRLPKGIFGRAIEMNQERVVHIPELKVKLTLLSSEKGRERASFRVDFLD